MTRLFLFLAALAAIGLIVTGAIQLRRDDQSITIEINRSRVRQDAKAVVDRGKEVFRKAEASLDRDVQRQ